MFLGGEIHNVSCVIPNPSNLIITRIVRTSFHLIDCEHIYLNFNKHFFGKLFVFVGDWNCDYIWLERIECALYPATTHTHTLRARTKAIANHNIIDIKEDEPGSMM